MGDDQRDPQHPEIDPASIFDRNDRNEHEAEPDQESKERCTGEESERDSPSPRHQCSGQSEVGEHYGDPVGAAGDPVKTRWR